MITLSVLVYLLWTAHYVYDRWIVKSCIYFKYRKTHLSALWEILNGAAAIILIVAFIIKHCK